MSIQGALNSATGNIVNATISANVKKQKEADTKASLEAKQKATEEKQAQQERHQIYQSKMRDVKMGFTSSMSTMMNTPMMMQIALDRQKMLANQKMILKDAKARAKFRNKARKGGK